MNIEKMIAYMKNNRDDLGAIKDSILEFATTSTPVMIRNFFVRCNKLKLPATSLAYYTMLWLAENDRTDVIESVVCSATPENIFYDVYRIGQSFADFRNGEIELGSANLREGLLYSSVFFHASKMSWDQIPDLDLLMRNAFLLEDLEWPNESPFRKPSFEIIQDNRFPSAACTCCVAFDSSLAERFFEEFIRTYRDKCERINLFLLLINPDECFASRVCGECDGIIVARTEYTGRWQAEFRSLARFMLSTDILNAIREPTVFMDIDAIFPDDASRLLVDLSRQDIGIIDTGSPLPTGMLSTKFVVSNADDVAKSFWKSVENIILSEFTRIGPLRGIGEMALLAATSGQRAKGDIVSVLNSDFESGANIIDVFYPEGDRLELWTESEVTNNYYRTKSITQEKRIEISENNSPARQTSEGSRYKKISIPWNLSNDTEKLIKFVADNIKNDALILEEILNYSDKINAVMLDHFFMECRRNPVISPPNLVFESLLKMVEQGKGDKVSALFEGSSESNPFWGLYSIGQSFRDCMNWEIEDCARNIREGLYHCLANEVNFENFNLMVQNAYLLETVTWPVEVPSYKEPEPLFDVICNNLRPGSPFPYMIKIGWSSEYLRKYIVRRIENIRNECGEIDFIIDIRDPAPDVIELIKGLDGVILTSINEPKYLAKGIESHGYYNWQKTKRLGEMFQKTIIGAELDSCYPSGIRDIYNYIANSDSIIYVDAGILSPALRIDSACQSYNPNGKNDGAFQELLQHFRREHLIKGGPIYLYDQIIRYRALCIAKKQNWKIDDLNIFMKGQFHHFFKSDDDAVEHPVKSMDVKWNSRSNSKFLFGGMTADKRIIWRPKPE